MISSFLGGIAGKMLAKYGAPWKLKKGYNLVKKLWRLGPKLMDAATDWWKSSKIAQKLGKGACNSFTPDTRVLMADGTSKAIKDVKIGDKVLATDPETGRSEVDGRMPKNSNNSDFGRSSSK